MKAPTVKRQRTVVVSGEKITFVARRITQQANLVGWKVLIKSKDWGGDQFFQVLTAKEAFDLAFVAFTKKKGRV